MIMHLHQSMVAVYDQGMFEFIYCRPQEIEIGFSKHAHTYSKEIDVTYNLHNASEMDCQLDFL